MVVVGGGGVVGVGILDVLRLLMCSDCCVADVVRVFTGRVVVVVFVAGKACAIVVMIVWL